MEYSHTILLHLITLSVPITDLVRVLLELTELSDAFLYMTNLGLCAIGLELTIMLVTITDMEGILLLLTKLSDAVQHYTQF